MEVSLDVSAVPLTEEHIKTFLLPRELRKDIPIEKVELTPDMIAAMSPLPDPVFPPGEFVPCTYEIGAPLNRLDDHEAEFKEMIKQMFESGPEVRLTKEGVEQQVEHYQESTSEIVLPIVENE